MAATRSSQGSAKSSQRSTKTTPQKPATKAGAKRKSAGDNDATSPPKKRGRPSKKDKEQKTIEETMDTTDDTLEHKDTTSQASKKQDRLSEKNKEQKTTKETVNVEDVEGNSQASQEGEDEVMKDVDGVEDDRVVASQINEEAGGNSEATKDNVGGEADKSTDRRDKKAKDSLATNGASSGKKNAFDEVKADTDDVKKAAQEEQATKTEHITTNNESVILDSARENNIPSSILEKGIIYFFFRARVNITDPQGIEDIARSYIVLRPLPLGAKLGDGPLEDSGNARLIALPKKMLPKSGRDRFLTFVDAANSSVKDLRDQFAGNEYATKTQGTSNTQAATPFAEGIYAITSTGRESHIAYHLTIPSPDKIGEIQHELGLAEKGSFIASVKNPKAPGPANVSINDPAEYPAKIQNKFGNLRWSPLEPEMLDYIHTQMLLIGEDRGELEKSVKEMGEDKKDDKKVSPTEEIDKLEEEDHDRVKHLKNDDPVFADLGLSSKEYPHLQTTW